MKIALSILITISASIIGSTAQNCPIELIEHDFDGVCNPFEYYLVFSDDFDGSSLDLSKWAYGNPVENDFNNPDSPDVVGEFPAPIAAFQSSNVEVSGGKLKITTRVEPVTYTVDGPYGLQTYDFNFTTGWINSKYNFGYGKYEIRCKIPHGMAFFPAFWMQWANGDIYSEIDVFEFFYRGGAATTLSDYLRVPKLTAWHKEVGSHINECREDEPTFIDFSSDFHTFTVYWDYYFTTWYIDNNPIPAFVVSHFEDLVLPFGVPCDFQGNDVSIYSHMAFPNSPMRIIISQYLSKHPEAFLETTFPGTFEIDYVKYYKQAPCFYHDLHDYNEIVDANNLYSPNILTPLDLQNTITGITIELRDEVNIDLTTNPYRQLNTFIAKQSITIDPTVYIDKQSTTVFMIDPELCEGEKMLELTGSQNSIENANIVTKDSNPLNRSIYPNPTTGELNIVTNFELPIKLQLHDCLGRIIHEETCFEKRILLNISEYPAGVYYLCIFKDSMMIQDEKIIKY